jgi:hypothetical protein
LKGTYGSWIIVTTPWSVTSEPSPSNLFDQSRLGNLGNLKIAVINHREIKFKLDNYEIVCGDLDLMADGWRATPKPRSLGPAHALCLDICLPFFCLPLTSPYSHRDGSRQFLKISQNRLENFSINPPTKSTTSNQKTFINISIFNIFPFIRSG